jgi:N-acyl-D-amino-acid deacylase
MSEARILIQGGMVYDGNGNPGAIGDVLVVGERVEAVGQLGEVRDAAVIDAAECCVTPGFIDPHNHADNEVEGGILAYPLADNLVRQGITTLVCNQCGGATYPVGGFLERFASVGAVTNVAMLASHGQTRSRALKETGGKNGPDMWRIMRGLLRDEIEAGALGVTTGIIGSSYERVPTDELIETGRAVAPYGGVYASHIRDEGEYGRHLEAIEEVATVARESGAKGHVSHLKLWGHPHWGQTNEVLAIFERARHDGVVLFADQYPYIGGYRGFFSLLWDKRVNATNDATWRALAEDEVRRQLDLLGGADRLYVSSHEQDDPLDGLTIGEAAEILSLRPEQVVPELFWRNPRPRLSAFFLAMCEEDVRSFMASEFTMVGTDSHVRVPNSGASHPRNFGVYPRLLGKYVREEPVMPMARMIQRMTSQVAAQFGIARRGQLKPGFQADIAIFDPTTVRDQSTWRNGYAYPVGIQHVIVNGNVTVRNGLPVGSGYGQAVRRGE